MALKPNLKYKNKKKEISTDKVVKVETDVKGEKSREMESYLKKLYNYLDNKHEKIILRKKLELGLKKALLFDDKKYKRLNKKDIE